MEILYTGKPIVKGNLLNREIPYKGKSPVKENSLSDKKNSIKENML